MRATSAGARERTGRLARWGLCAALLTVMLASAGPASAEIPDNSYTSSEYGFSVTWDPEVWQQDVDYTDEASVMLVADAGFVLIGGSEYADPQACLQDSIDPLDQRAASGEITDLERVSAEPLPEPGAGAEAALYSYIAEGDEVFFSMECRPFNDGANTLIIWSQTEAGAHFSEMLPALEELVSGLELPGAPDGAADTSAGAKTYTSPTYGFSVSWDPDVWTADRAAQVVNDGPKKRDQLRLENDRGFVNVIGVTAFDGDPAACLAGHVEELASDRSVRDFVPFDADGALPAGESGDVAYAAFRATLVTGIGDPEEIGAYIGCETLVRGESLVVLAVAAAPEDLAEQVAAAADVAMTLMLTGGSRPAGEAATPSQG